MFRRFGAMPGEGDGADGFASQPGVGPCPFIGKIETIAGTCSLIRAGRIIVEIKVGDPVCRGDVVKTATDGRVGIRFIDGTAFSLSNNARMMLREFVCGGDSPSAQFDVTRGAFAFIAGAMAKAGRLGIDTPVASIRGRTRTGGVGTLTFSALIFAVMEEARAESPGNAFLDDGTITYNGVFELVTKEAHPRHILVDNPAETIVLHRIGSSIAADQIFNTAAQMEQLRAAQQEALHVFSLGLAQGPTATGPGGSGAPPLFEIPSLFTQPINYTPPPDNTPPPLGPTGPGPNIPTPPVFQEVIFTPPPAGPGKINEVPGHTGDPVIDSTTGSTGLSFGTATLNGPTFVWSKGSLTDGQKGDLTAASTLTLSDSGGSVGFTYSAADHTFDFLAGGETLTITYDVTVGGVTQSAVITVTGTNDTPMITSAAQGASITEMTHVPLPNPTGSTVPDTANGAVTFTDADLNDHHQVAVTGVVASGVTTGLADQTTQLSWLTLGALTDTTGTGLGGSQPWSFAAADKNFDYLAANETLTLTYTIQVDDGNGGTVSQNVVITVTGTNDTPVITSADSAESKAITEAFNTPQPNPTGSSSLDQANGAVTFTDVDLSDHHQVTITGFVASGTTSGLDQAAAANWLTLGTLTDTTGTGLGGSQPWSFAAADKNFDYLAANEKLTLTYTVQVDDGNGGTVSQNVVITVTGTNDTPVITSADSAESKAITEAFNTPQPNPTGSTTPDTANGAVTFTDVDLSDHHQVTVTGFVASGTTSGLDQAAAANWLTLGTLTDTTGTGLGGSQPWSFAAADQNFDYLAAGETLTLTYTVQVDDGNGGTVSQPVTITVTGTNDTPVITSADSAESKAITEAFNTPQPNPTGSSALDQANGVVTFTDVDLSDTHTVTVTGVVASGVTTGLASNATVLDWLTLGTLSDSTGGVIGSDGWTFSAQDKNFDYLAAGETLTLTYTVQVDDGHGGIATQPVTITVTGTNDTPVITSSAQSGAITEETNPHQPNPTGSTDLDKASGTATFTDVDLSDTHTVTVTGVVASGVTTGLASNATVLDWLTLGTLSDSTGGVTGSDGWTFSAQDKNFDYLAAGETLTLTYTVQVDDGHGGIATQPVTITVTGTNDTPVIAVASGDSAAATLTESYKTLSTAGTLTVTDADLSDTVTASVTGVTLGGTKGGLTSADVLGMLSVTGGAIAANPADTHNLAWSFNSSLQTFNFLDAGESLTLTYTVQVNDGHGGITNQAVTITIDGTNQPDLITSFTGIDSHGYVGEHTPVTLHVSDGGVDVTSHASYQWQVLEPGFFGPHWVTVSTSNSFSQVETYEGEQLRVTASYTEAGGTDSITTYLGQISDNDSDDRGATVKIQNLPGNLQIGDGTALELAAMSAVAVLFPTGADAYGKLVIDHAASYTGTISNFTGTSTQSDAIDLKDIAFDAGTSFTYHDNSGFDTGGTLTIRESGHTVDTITFANGEYTAANFTLLSDGNGGTLIVDPPSSATISGASAALTTGIDTLTFDNGAHQVSGTDQTLNNGDKLTGGTGANTLTVDSGNGDHNYTFGDGNHTDIGLTNFAKLALTDANATSDDAVTVTFDSSFHNNGTLTVDGSALTHLNGTNLTVDAHLAASDSFVIIGSASADTLIGGSHGNNTITGGGGGDTLTGNGANDTFVYKFTTDSQPGAGHFDTITNFTHTADHFDFSAISGLNSTVQGVTFNSLTAAPDSLAAHTIDIVTSGGNTVIYANASGATETLAHVDMEIHANNVTNVHSTDFILHA